GTTQGRPTVEGRGRFAFGRGVCLPERGVLIGTCILMQLAIRFARSRQRLSASIIFRTIPLRSILSTRRFAPRDFRRRSARSIGVELVGSQTSYLEYPGGRTGYAGRHIP